MKPETDSSQNPKPEVLMRHVTLVTATAGGLTLSFQPDAVFASSSSTLTLNVSVDLNGSPVTITPQGGIAVSFPVDNGSNVALVSTLSGITATPPNVQWTVTGPSSGKFIIRPANTTTLTPGMSLQFIFRSLPIVAATGTPNVPVQVNATTGSSTTNISVSVQPLVPGVIAWADPPMVGLNAQSTLRWVSNGGTKVRVIGYTSSQVPSGYKDFPVGGVTNTKVNSTLDSGNPPGAQHPYQVELLAEPGDQIQGTVQNVFVYLHSPFISQFGLQQPDQSFGPSVTIPYGTPVTAKWNCLFVDPNQGVTLSYGSVNQLNAPVSQPPPFDPSSALAPNDDSVTLTLTAPGWNTPAVGTTTVNYSPSRILYFKFTNWTVDKDGKDVLSGMNWEVDPPAVQAQSTGSDPTYSTVTVLSVTAPGGPFTQYLGTGTDPYLQIRYFSPSGPVTAGTPFTLQWFTNSATSLTLTSPSGNTAIPAAQIAKGTSDPLTITAATTYVLTATSSNGTSVNSYLTVTPS